MAAIPAATRARAGWSWLAVLVLGAGMLLLALNQLVDVGARVHGDGVLRFDHARLVAADGSESGPVPMRLEGNCHARGHCAQRYRITFEHVADAGQRYALYVPQYTGRVQVEFNGVPMADSALDQASLRQGQGAPLIATLPDRLLQPGFNEIGVDLAGRLGAGAIGPVFFGPDELLRRHYGNARFLVVMLPRLMDGALLAIGAIMLLIWLARRSDPLYLLCAAISLAFAVSSLAPVIGGVLGDGFLMPANVARYVGACLVLPFACRLADRAPPVHAAWFLLPGVLMYFAFDLLPAAWSTLLLTVLFVPLALLLGAIALWVLWRAGMREGNRTALTLGVAIAVLLALAARDQLVTAGVLGHGHVLMARFNGPVLAMIMGTILLRRFAEGLSLMEHFNARLQSDVAAARAELHAMFERDKANARRAALSEERMRLMADLHDGIAGQLMSIVAMGERTTDPAARDITQACHRALTDLRLVVDSMEDVGDDLGMMLVAFRDRIEPQLRRAGIRLDWRVRGLPDLPGLSPATTLAIFRVLQEAVNNAARHSGSDRIEVASEPSPRPGHGVRLLVRDHGRGGAIHRRGHHGMDNMRRRAEGIGAALEVDSGPGGTTVALDLPVSLVPGHAPVPQADPAATPAPEKVRA